MQCCRVFRKASNCFVQSAPIFRTNIWRRENEERQRTRVGMRTVTVRRLMVVMQLCTLLLLPSTSFASNLPVPNCTCTVRANISTSGNVSCSVFDFLFFDLTVPTAGTVLPNAGGVVPIHTVATIRCGRWRAGVGWVPSRDRKRLNPFTTIHQCRRNTASWIGDGSRHGRSKEVEEMLLVVPIVHVGPWIVVICCQSKLNFIPAGP